MEIPDDRSKDDKFRVIQAVYNELPKKIRKNYSLEEFERDFARGIAPLIRNGETAVYWLNRGEDRYARDLENIRENEARRLEAIVNKK